MPQNPTNKKKTKKKRKKKRKQNNNKQKRYMLFTDKMTSIKIQIILVSPSLAHLLQLIFLWNEKQKASICVAIIDSPSEKPFDSKGTMYTGPSYYRKWSYLLYKKS